MAVAFIPGKQTLAFYLYLYAAASDALDGALARSCGVASTGGAALDIACDKYLTIYSLLFLAAADVALVPLCLALVRDIFVQAFRSISLDGRAILVPVRTVGLTVVIPIRFTVGYALLQRLNGVWLPGTLDLLAWTCGVVSALVLMGTMIIWRDELRRVFIPE